MKTKHKAMLNAVVSAVKSRGIDVCFTSDDQDQIEIGELRKGQIRLNAGSRDDLSMAFTLAHLFGHYCQFHHYDEYEDIIEQVKIKPPLKLPDEFKMRFRAYEYEAFGIGKSLMVSSFKWTEEIDVCYQIFFQTDFDHFWNYITTGKKGKLSDFNRLLTSNYKKKIISDERIAPLPITGFTGIENNTTEVIIF